MRVIMICGNEDAAFIPPNNQAEKKRTVLYSAWAFRAGRLGTELPEIAAASINSWLWEPKLDFGRSGAGQGRAGQGNGKRDAGFSPADRGDGRPRQADGEPPSPFLPCEACQRAWGFKVVPHISPSEQPRAPQHCPSTNPLARALSLPAPGWLAASVRDRVRLPGFSPGTPRPCRRSSGFFASCAPALLRSPWLGSLVCIPVQSLLSPSPPNASSPRAKKLRVLLLLIFCLFYPSTTPRFSVALVCSVFPPLSAISPPASFCVAFFRPCIALGVGVVSRSLPKTAV